jgi:hypothetical protein
MAGRGLVRCRAVILKARWSLTMCADFLELAHHLAVIHAHIMHISRLTAEMATCVESRAGKRLALDLSSAALQVSINAQELDTEARRVQQITDDLIQRDEKGTFEGLKAVLMAHSAGAMIDGKLNLSRTISTNMLAVERKTGP